MAKTALKIEETEHIVDDHFFDFVGNEFKDHVKGLAEWLKNSVDAYIHKGAPSNEQYVWLRFGDSDKLPTIECVDFVGMEESNIEKAFKRWGDPMASKRGNAKAKTYGGHGNGGKFYMRQAFDESYFVTYKNGLLNVFGFGENKKYGYATGHKNKKMDVKAALKFASIDFMEIPKQIQEELTSGKTGFTVVRGIGPFGIKDKHKKLSKELERLKNHPQSRRILERAQVSVYLNNRVLDERLRPEELPPYERFEEPRVITVPQTLTRSGKEKVTVVMGNDKFPLGILTLKTSAEPLTQGVKPGELNRVDILGAVGVIGSYQLFEMGVKGFPHAAHIYGEFGPAQEGEATILENPDNDCVSNDRAKLIVNDVSRALIEWIQQEVDKLAADIAAVEREKQKMQQKDIASMFNDVLNEWKNKHMGKIMSELFGGGSGTGSPQDDDEGENKGKQVSLPPNGFDFKYPQIEIAVDTPAKATLKVSVPQALPLGAVIDLSVDDGSITLENQRYAIKSDYLRSTPDGQEVAFIQVVLTGTKAGVEGTLTATAGSSLKATLKIKVVEKKESKSNRAFPQVLLSGYTPDPLGFAAGGTLFLSERDPVVYQRPQDVASSIYWINTSSPMAAKIDERFTFDSAQGRNFLFERYVDIFVKEAIHKLEKDDYQNFNADRVDEKIADVIKKVHQSAREDLESFLFDESYTAPATPASQ